MLLLSLTEIFLVSFDFEGRVAMKWLVRRTPDQEVRVEPWPGHCVVFWASSELSGKPDEILGVTCDGLASHPGGVAILLVASCYRNREKLPQLCEPGSCLNLSLAIKLMVMASTLKLCSLKLYPIRFQILKLRSVF